MLAPSLKIMTNTQSTNLYDLVPGSYEIRFIDVIELVNNGVSRSEIAKWIRLRKKQLGKKFVVRVGDPHDILGSAGVDILA